FSLAEPERINSVLTAAGFTDITVDVVAGSRLITSASADDDVRALLEVGPLGEAFGAADDEARQAAVAAVLAAVEPFREEQGWRLPGVAHNVLARRP
ncbi:MAG: hypothetical protein QOD38_2219, partial [Acidimicrobiaceae bacterium]